MEISMTLYVDSPASRFCTDNTWRKAAQMDSRFRYHRPTPIPSVVPVELRLPVFAHFLENCQRSCLPIDDEEMRAMEEFFTEMCCHFDSEANRAQYARERLSIILGVDICRYDVQGQMTDGSFAGSDFRTAGLLMNLEVKNELGTGSDPFLQNWNYQAKFWASHRAYHGPHASFTMILAGPNIAVCGAICTKSSVVQEWLTPLLPMNVSPNSLHCTKIVQALAALRRGLQELQEFDSTLAIVPEMPFIDFGSDTEPIKILKPLYKDEDYRLLYHGTFGDRDAVIKCSRTYCVDAHQFLAKQGMAPEIFACQKVASWTVIVMEHVKSNVTVVNHESLKKVIETLHKGGFVHGDARQSNFIWRAEGVPLLIDFDTAGVSGSTYYPPFLNPDSKWPDQTGKIILKEDDMAMLQMM